MLAECFPNEIRYIIASIAQTIKNNRNGVWECAGNEKIDVTQTPFLVYDDHQSGKSGIVTQE